MSDTPAGKPPPRRLIAALLLSAAILVAIGLRVTAPRSDPYPKLDWDTGILTDEGFYTHNARSAVLFGTPHTDEFDNMLAAPLLHALQVGVFSLVGTGAVPARMISVVCSLLTLPLLYACLRRPFGVRVAATAALILALDHTNLLFNRLALLDTPAALLATAALYAFTRVTTDPQPDADNGQSRAPMNWALLCGILLGFTVANRTLCAYLLPVPFIALRAYPAPSRAARLRLALAIAGGLALVLCLYLAAIYVPNRAEIAHMNRYYRMVQIQPRTLARLWSNVRIAFMGETYGIFPYLYRHTPVVWILALLAVGTHVATPRARPQAAQKPEAAPSAQAPPASAPPPGPTCAVITYLVAWLLLAWALLAVSNYSPNRYFVSTYPALAALAAWSLWNLGAAAKALAAPTARARALRAAIVWFVVYHAFEAIFHRGGILPDRVTLALLYSLPTLAAAGCFTLSWGNSAPGDPPGKHSPAMRPSEGELSAQTAPHSPGQSSALARYRVVIVLVWLAVNLVWLGDWGLNLRYSQYETGRWLETHLPPESVILGDVAPGLTMDTKLLGVNVMKGLSNDRDPVHRWSGRPTYIAMLDGSWRTPYWVKRYPALVDRRRRIYYRKVIRWWIGIYPANPPP